MTQQEFFKRYKYSIRTDKVGGGAFGTVYRAFDEELNREVAIKVSEVKIMGGKEFSLKDEFDAIKNVPVQRNIANYESLHTFESPQGIFDYAVMQFYKDGNLSSFIKSNPTFDQKEQVALDLLNGIIHLHAHKVVHRDLKPGNILIVKRGDKIIPVITDFGLSKNAEMEGQSRFSNSFGGGTLKYSSPEQLKAEKLRLNTDLWAYGVIVHEIFTGKNLFMAQNITGASAEAEKEIYEQIIGVDISSMINELPGKWQEVVKQCLVRDGAKRIKSGVAVKELIENGPSTEPPKETFTDDATQIMGDEPEEFIDDETIIDDGKSTQKKAPAKNKFIAKKEFQKTKTPAKPSKKTNPLVYAVPLVILIAVALFLWKPWAKEITPSDLQTYNGYKEQAVNAYKKDSMEVALNYYKAAETFMKGLEIKQANDFLVKEGVKDSIAAISARLEAITKVKETKAWEAAKNQNTIKSYNAYKTAYQQGIFVVKANANILMLKDEVNNLTKLKEKADNDKLDLNAWNKAKKENTSNAYNTYLTSFSQGNYNGEAKKAIAKLKNKDKLIANEKSSLGPTNKWLLEINSYKSTTKSLTKVFNQIKNYSTNEGKARLSYLYLTGKGVKKDLKKANDLSLQPAKENNGLAQYVQGAVLHRRGYNNDLKRNSEVFKWISLAAENDIYLAYNLKAYYHIYVGRNIKEDRSLGMEYLKKSVALGSIEAVEEIANLYTADAVVKKENIAKAVEWQKKVAKLKPNDGYAHFQLAHIYFWTDAGSWPEYYNCLKISAERGNVEGMYRLGAALKSGMGTTKNTSEAIKWFKKSVDKGYKGDKELKALGVTYTPNK